MEKKKKEGADHFAVLIAFLMGVCTTLLGMVLVLLILQQHWPAGATEHPAGLVAAEKTKTIVELIDKVYVGDIDESQMADSMYRGLISGLGDKYSTYYTKSEYESVRESQLGYHKGIGAGVSLDGDALLIVSVQENSTAEEAGLLANDRIVAVNDEQIAGKTLDQAIGLLREAKEDSVILTIQREGEQLKVEVNLMQLEETSVTGTLVEDEIAYLRITGFTARTPDQFTEELESLREQGAKKLIVDLRNNPGGLLSAVCDTLRLILPEGLIVYTMDKQGKKHEYSCQGESPLDIPLVVLVNHNSASASEIFTGAVQDYGIGTIVGETTFGKGVVQNAFTLLDGSVVKLTVEHYYTPLGKDIHGAGIQPDVEVELPADATEDVQLLKALEVLKEGKKQ